MLEEAALTSNLSRILDLTWNPKHMSIAREGFPSFQVN